MDLAGIGSFGRLNITSPTLLEAVENRPRARQANTNNEAFGPVLQTAMNLLNETSQLQNQAEEAKMQFALGNANSTHELSIAREKASVALQYTISVRDRFVESYKEIMNMSV